MPVLCEKNSSNSCSLVQKLLTAKLAKRPLRVKCYMIHGMSSDEGKSGILYL